MKLEGDVRWEVLCQGGIGQFSEQSLLGALREIFVKRGVASRLLTKFWVREQWPGESLVAYNYSLMELLEQLKGADPSDVSDGDAMLRKKFQAGVSNANLRWELSRVLKDDSTKFVDLQKVALQLADQCYHRETEDPRQALTTPLDRLPGIAQNDRWATIFVDRSCPPNFYFENSGNKRFPASTSCPLHTPSALDFERCSAKWLTLSVESTFVHDLNDPLYSVWLYGQLSIRPWYESSMTKCKWGCSISNGYQ